MKNILKELEKILDSSCYNLDDYTAVVFGAGNTSVLYQKCFEHEGIHPVYYVDNDVSKQNTVFQGVQVISMEQLLVLAKSFSKPPLVLICSAQISVCVAISKQIEQYNLLSVHIDKLVFSKNKDKVLKVFDMLSDDYSKEIYAGLIESRMLYMQTSEHFVSDNQYFCLPSFLKLKNQEVFVDAGAFTGDTIEQFLNKKSGSFFSKIVAFEPDFNNWTAMNRRVERLKAEWGIHDSAIILERAGVGSRTEKMGFASAANGGGGGEISSRIGASFSVDKTPASQEVTVYALDDYFKEQRVTFIKADIESYELDMLRGAQKIIKRDKPLLAICIYHNASDMFTIPMFIKQINPDYHLKIRHHTFDLLETVLYAYI